MIADIHFQPRYVFAAIEAGCAAVRVNPGNIKKFDDQVKEIARAAKDHGTSIRIGVNAGSLDPRLLQKHGKATPEALVESARWEASLFEEHDFHDFKISVKHNDPVVMVRAYEMLVRGRGLAAAPRGHRGGSGLPGHHQVLGRLRRPALEGDRRHDPGLALRTAGRGGQGRAPDPRVAQPAARAGSRSSRAPRAAAAQVDVYKLAEEVTAGLEGMEVPLRVAVMGCVVNGPGEAREADLGVASGNGKGQIFVKGQVVKTVPESQIVETLIEEAMRIAEEMEPVEGSEAVVSVS